MQSGKYIFTTCELCGEMFVTRASHVSKLCDFCRKRNFESRQNIKRCRLRAEKRRRLEERDRRYERAFPNIVATVERRGNVTIETRGRALVAPRTNLNIFGVRLRGEI